MLFPQCYQGNQQEIGPFLKDKLVINQILLFAYEYTIKKYIKFVDQKKIKTIKIKRFDKMKNQNSDSKLDETSVSIDHSTVKNCPSANPATLVCCNKSCDRIAYICDNKSCKCYKQHSTCPHLSIQSIMNTIQGKIIPFNHFQESILNKIDKTIDQLSKLKEKLQGEIRQNFALYGLTKKDKNLFGALNKQKITGKQISLLFHETNCQENIFVQKEALDKKFAQLWKSVDEEIKSKSSQFFNFLQYMNEKDKFAPVEQLKNSKIKINEVDQYNLLKMFGYKVPKSAKLLYRASQNNFKADKFHEKCDNIPHTLTLCETTYGKVIGGYTPLLWNCKSGANLKDESGSSFIFSLTNNHKFILDKSKDATRPHVSLGPAFGSGGPDFYIDGSANTSSSSYTLINKSYVNQNYKAEDGESYMKFNGNPAKIHNYLSKEWQVWQLEFNP